MSGWRRGEGRREKGRESGYFGDYFGIVVLLGREGSVVLLLTK